jgi:hypothetical protein
VISTRTYQDRLDTLDRVRDAGINVLRGIIGMGESRASARADFAAREPNPYPDSVPINNLVAIEGTPLEGTAPLDPFEFAHDRGRAHHDAEGRRAPVGRPRAARRRLQALFLAGANSMFYGDQLLTTSNRNRRRSRVVRAARHARERRGRDVRRRVSVSALARRARSGGRICAAWRAPTRRGGRSAISRACLNEARQRRRRERQNPMLRKTWGSSAFRAGTSAGFFRNAGATPAPASPCAAAPSSAARTRATCSASTGASTSPRGRTPEPKCTALHAGGAHEIADRIDRQPRAGQHRARRAGRLPHQPRDRRDRVEHRRMAARSQHRRDGRHAQQRVERGVQIAGDVEGAWNVRAPVGGGRDPRERVDIDVAVRIERAEHDAVRAGRDGRARRARSRAGRRRRRRTSVVGARSR